MEYSGCQELKNNWESTSSSLKAFTTSMHRCECVWCVCVCVCIISWANNKRIGGRKDLREPSFHLYTSSWNLTLSKIPKSLYQEVFVLDGDYILIFLYKSQLKMFKNLGIRPETMQLEENIELILQHIDTGNNFLSRAPKVQEIMSS